MFNQLCKSVYILSLSGKTALPVADWQLVPHSHLHFLLLCLRTHNCCLDCWRKLLDGWPHTQQGLDSKLQVQDQQLRHNQRTFVY